MIGLNPTGQIYCTLSPWQASQVNPGSVPGSPSLAPDPSQPSPAGTTAHQQKWAQEETQQTPLNMLAPSDRHHWDSASTCSARLCPEIQGLKGQTGPQLTLRILRPPSPQKAAFSQVLCSHSPYAHLPGTLPQKLYWEEMKFWGHTIPGSHRVCRVAPLGLRPLLPKPPPDSRE